MTIDKNKTFKSKIIEASEQHDMGNPMEDFIDPEEVEAAVHILAELFKVMEHPR